MCKEISKHVWYCYMYFITCTLNCQRSSQGTILLHKQCSCAAMQQWATSEFSAAYKGSKFQQGRWV